MFLQLGAGMWYAWFSELPIYDSWIVLYVNEPTLINTGLSR